VCFSVTSDLDIYRSAKALIEEHGLQGAATHALNRITQLYEQNDFYELSACREIRNAIADLAAEARAADNPGDD
jgi:hypothetical protein